MISSICIWIRFVRLGASGIRGVHAVNHVVEVYASEIEIVSTERLEKLVVKLVKKL